MAMVEVGEEAVGLKRAEGARDAGGTRQMETVVEETVVVETEEASWVAGKVVSAGSVVPAAAVRAVSRATQCSPCSGCT